MSKNEEPACNVWEVDRKNSGSVMKPYCLVILRNKKVGTSIVKASSTDLLSMYEYEEELKRDLERLTDEQFMRKYRLRSSV